MLFNLLRDLGGHLNWLIPGSPLFQEWQSTFNAVKNGDPEAAAEVDSVALQYHYEYDFDDRFGSKTKAPFKGYSKEKSLLAFPGIFFDRRCKRAIFRHQNGNEEALKLMRERANYQKRGRAEFRAREYAPLATSLEETLADSFFDRFFFCRSF